MNKTPRTDEQILHHDNGNGHPSAFVYATFARQLELELAEARAEIERLKGVVISQITPEPFTPSSYSTTAEPAKDERDKLIEQMGDALKALKQRHYVNDDDNWYSCPASGLCSNDHAGTDCNCGADHVNSIIQAALRAADGGE